MLLDIQDTRSGDGGIFAANNVMARMQEYEAFVHNKDLHQYMHDSHLLLGNKPKAQAPEPAQSHWSGVVGGEGRSKASMEEVLNDMEVLSLLHPTSPLFFHVLLFLPCLASRPQATFTPSRALSAGPNKRGNVFCSFNAAKLGSGSATTLQATTQL